MAKTLQLLLTVQLGLVSCLHICRHLHAVVL